MAFEIPTLDALANRAWSAFKGNLKGSDARLWPNNVAVSAKVIAGAVSESFSFLSYISEQIFASSADWPFLLRHGREYGMAPLPATYAEGYVRLTGDIGTLVAAGTVLQRVDGVQYVVVEAGTVDGTRAVTLPVKAAEAGRAGNAIAGVGVSLLVPRDGLVNDGEVASTGIGLGADPEGREAFRQRVLFRKRYPPHGGAAHDYVAWAREYNPAITRVYVDPVTATNGRSSVGVWFLMDGTYANGIPQAADVAGLAAYIDSVRPAGAVVQIAAPTTIAVDMTIAGLSPNTLAVQQAIRAELADLFFRSCRVSTSANPYVLFRSQVDAAISNAIGEAHHTPPLTADITPSLGQIPVLGQVVFA